MLKINSIFTKSNNEINEEKKVKKEYLDYIIDEKKSLLFFQIWNNIILKNKILLENRLFLINSSHRVSFNNLKELLQYPQQSKENLYFIKFNQALTDSDLILFKESIPPSVEIIYLPPKLNCAIDSKLIPNQVHTVYLNSDYKFPLENENQISNSIKNLFIFSFKRHKYLIDVFEKSKYNQLINCINDDSQIKFTFNNKNNNNNGLIINDDKKLQLSHHERAFIVNSFIPCSFETIKFGLNFNQDLIGGILPPGVNKIKFVGSRSPCSIKPFSIPESVIFIQFTRTSNFNEVMGENCLPKNLKRFEMSDSYSRLVQFPPSLSRLSIGKEFNHFPINKILSNDGNSLEFLEITRAKHFDGNFKDLPKSIKTLSLSLDNIFRGAIDNKNFIPLNFNSNITELYLCNIKPMPPTFKLKSMPNNYLPSSVTSLHFIDCSVLELNQIHSNITILSLPNEFNQSLKQIYDSKVKYLSFGSQFNQDLTLPESLPISLITLNIGSSNSLSNDNLKIDHLPSTLKTIKTFNTNLKFLKSNLLNSLIISPNHTVKIITKKY
ncbi:hypothetical protein ACTFIY_008269 [Dictyostelium cf. discoideum]